MQQKILIIDFGSQYTQLIARRVRELNAYCEIHPFNKIPEADASVKGVILSGSPMTVTSPDAPAADLAQFAGRLPLLGIGYGAHLLAVAGGGKVSQNGARQYAARTLTVTDGSDPLLGGIPSPTQVWASLGDNIASLPGDCQALATTPDLPAAAFRVRGQRTWGLEFHPEVYHTTEGKQLIQNFVVDICGCEQDWTPASFIEAAVAEIKAQVGGDKVVLALSGGVDSTVSAVLLNRAIGRQLSCIFVDHGLLRMGEFESVLESYKHMGLNVTGVRAADKFLGDLKGVSDPEGKRKIIGRDFIEVFEEQARGLKDVKWLAQGTIYPDVIESVSLAGPGGTIKSHHNVGGLPERMNLGLVEPLRLLFKDEVRRVGRELGIDPTLLGRHPFPGPGLGIRVLGEVSAEKLAVLQQADRIFIDALRAEGLYDKVWQAAAILLPVQSVGVTGDQRTFENALALRAVNSMDGMTADWVELPYEFLKRVSGEIINKVRGVNRVVYDISPKPPATIEWE